VYEICAGLYRTQVSPVFRAGTRRRLYCLDQSMLFYLVHPESGQEQ
jgi:hypothetical protein